MMVVEKSVSALEAEELKTNVEKKTSAKRNLNENHNT
jgi:hypothetical protein